MRTISLLYPVLLGYEPTLCSVAPSLNKRHSMLHSLNNYFTGAFHLPCQEKNNTPPTNQHAQTAFPTVNLWLIFAN